MADDWSRFPVAEDPAPDEWAAFPVVGKGKPKAKGKSGKGAILAGAVLGNATATDGDTVRADQGKVRLVGIDAPESDQLGFDRAGQPVPIGKQSSSALLDFLGRGVPTTGNPFGLSYGRTVAPVTVGGVDAGAKQLRLGQALAAPEYLKGDPERASLYQQDERLARLNGLGLHDTFMPQTPAEFRAEPADAPDRETVARFFGTPTPLQGLPADKEAQLRQLYATGTAAEINGFLRANGYETTRAADLAAFIAKRDKGAKADTAVTYQDAPPLMIDSGDGAGGAAVRKGASGFLAGGLDELGAVVDTLGGTGGRESIWNSDRRLADIWANNQRQNAGILAYDQTAHPVASTASEVAGGLLGGFAIPYGQGARTIPELAKVGAVFGGATGFLGTDGNVADRSLGAVKGTLAGALATPVFGKVLEAATPVVARALGRGAAKAADGAGEASGGMGPRVAPDAPPAAPAGNSGDEWAGFPVVADDAASPRTLAEMSPRERAALDADIAKAQEPLIQDPTAEGGWRNETPEEKAVRHAGIDAARDTSIRLDSPLSIPMDAAPGESLSAPAPLPDPREKLIDSLASAGAGEATINAALKAKGLDPLPIGGLELRQRARPLADDYTTAERLAAAERVGPRDVLPVPGNTVADAEEAAAIEAGRYGPAKVANERDYLDRLTVPGLNGPVPKVGPVDLVGFLRAAGGLKLDPGGELANMGLTNAARRGLDHVGQETRFGPLIDDQGMNLDDAALAAWEAGYFPEHSDRPSINDFLDGLHGTYNGYRRRFRLDDQPQLEAFDAARQERNALEQQLADGPVYTDRSQAVGPEAPFAPPEAYDDASREAIRRVGNIDVSKLDSPQDIARALKTSHNTLGGFDAATRGRITQAETEKLASDLGMTADQLLTRRKGQAFNAEEALAARQILAKSGNELVNAAKAISKRDDPGEELLAEFRQKWMRHVAIQEQVSGMTAEAGRALQQFRQAADSRAVRTDVLNAMVRGGGGKAGLQDAANVLLDAVEMGPGKFNVLAAKAAKPKWARKIGELYINMLLSNPPTHIVNMVSNSLTAMGQIPEYATASIIGAGRKALLGQRAKEAITASEVGARTFGMVQGAKEGLGLFAKALRSGEADDFVSKVEGDEFKAISGLKGEIIRTPTRFLTAEDQFFKGVARRMAINGLSMRQAQREGLKGEALAKRVKELTANPPDEIWNAALDEGLYLTFQRRLGDFGQSVSRMSGSNLLAKVVVPFVRTPINLMKFATERSPAAPLLKEWRADFAAGGERRDLAVAKVLLGSGFATMVYQAAMEGRITGAVPPDPAKARLLYADGWQPYSIKVGDRYVSYSRLDPFSTTIGVAADMATLPSGLSDRQKDDRATMLVASIMGSLASKTWLSGASAFTEALSDPGRYAENWVQRTAGAFTVPAGVAGVARAIDPVSRKRESIGEAVQARVPGLTDDLLPRRDIFGEPIANDSLGPDFLSPFWQSKDKSDPVVGEMLRIGKSVSAPGKQFTEDGERVDYSPEQYDRYHEIAGRLTYNKLLGLIGSEEYRAADDNGRRKAAKKAIAAARKDARAVLDDPRYQIPAKGAPASVPAAGSDPWSAFPAVDGAKPDGPDPWAAFPQADARDPQAALAKAIPGIQFTSGYRDPAYNASLRARGYHPSDNSEHLDGSALDMLPPPGKSLEWLREQVRRYDPKARLLVHDGHLHGGFDGYNSAPKLGGMVGR